jgi:hypothetical protein
MPILEVDRTDGFDPIAFWWLTRLAYQGQQTTYCFQGPPCVNPMRFPLPPYQGLGDNLDYPGPDNPTAQAAITNEAMSVYHWTQANHPQVYFYVSRPTGGVTTIQYWYFYSYNYYNCDIGCPVGPHLLSQNTSELTHDRHTGDWEHVDVKVDAERRVVGYTLSQHELNVPIARGGLRTIGTHPVVYAALGDHANYPQCYSNGIRIAGAGGTLGNTDATCAHGLTQIASNAALANIGQYSLARQWGCWDGIMGNKTAATFKLPILNANPGFGESPKAPLVQSQAPGAGATCTNASQPTIFGQ